MQKIKLVKFVVDFSPVSNHVDDSRGITRLEVLGRIPCVGETVEGDRVLAVDHTFHKEHVAVVTLEPTCFRNALDFDGDVERILETGWKRDYALVYEHDD